jgi:hypothetical protein
MTVNNPYNQFKPRQIGPNVTDRVVSCFGNNPLPTLNSSLLADCWNPVGQLFPKSCEELPGAEA